MLGEDFTGRGDREGMRVADPGPRPLSTFEQGWHTTSIMPDPLCTFPEVFAQRASQTPHAVAFYGVTLAGRELEARPLTFAQLDGMARGAAQAFLHRGVAPGDRVMLSVAAPDVFFACFLGAQAIGAIPVPLPSLTDVHVPTVFRERIRSVSAACTPHALVLDSPTGWQLLEGDRAHVPLIIDVSADGLPTQTPTTMPAYDPCRSWNEVAFLQFTSGSTGDPRGVIVTHYNLVANFRASIEAAALSHHDRNFSWLPLFHDMGLIGGLLQTVYLHIPTFVMSPRLFMARPSVWLRAITRFRITLSTAPNFAYNLLARRLPDGALAGLDLSSWRLALCGAEPIDHRTVDAFTRRFEPYGFRSTCFFPVYGLAEATLSVAYPRPGSPVHYDIVDRELLHRQGIAAPTDFSAHAVTFTSVGRAIPAHQLRIVDPHGNAELPERRVGEIVVEGPSVTPGYFQQSSVPALHQPKLRTGDLGYFADGELFVVDRLKELLLIAGNNYVPSDIERLVGTIPGVRSGAVVAFGLRGLDGTDELYIVAGTEGGGHATTELREAVRRTIQEHLGIAPRDICIVRSGAIPKTSSGKLQRAACRRLYEKGAFRSTNDPVEDAS